ncbi:MAG: beta-hexosaminidase [Oscillospiraceae bacterium]|nr:beta-hexosaminidase [Oscillospiraceae bacterium]
MKSFMRRAAGVLLPMVCALTAAFSGCEAVGEKVNNFLENDSNIGKNAPAVMGTLADPRDFAQSEELAETEISEEEKAAARAAEVLRKQTERAEEIAAGMTAEEKIGQMLLARCPENAAEEMEKYAFGGYTLYAEDFEKRSREEVREFTREIAKAAKAAPFIAVDEEGGTVVRVSKFGEFRDEPFSSPQLLYNRGGTELLEIDGSEKARLLLSLGINFNLAPVADISTDSTSYIYPRTLGQGAQNTADGIRAMVSVADKAGIASCLKHFPGYGENTDTHKGAAHDGRELSEFAGRDYIPFEAGINATEGKTPAVMVGHTVYDVIDPEVPASLSAVIHKELRETLGFDGVAVTDDMGMDAVKEYAGEGSPYVMAVLADNDLLCVTDFETAYSDLKAAYENGEITDEILDIHVIRILRMKIQYGIIS